MSRLPTTVITAGRSAAKVGVKDVDMFVTAQLLQDAPNVFLISRLVEQIWYSHEWKGQAPDLLGSDEHYTLQIGQLRANGCPRPSSAADFSGSAGDSAETTRRSTSRHWDEQSLSSNQVQDSPELVEEILEKLMDTPLTSSGSDRADPPEPTTDQDEICTYLHTFPWMRVATSAYVRRSRELRADATLNATYSARLSSVTSLQPTTRSSMKEESRDRVTGMQLWYKIWPLDGFKATHLKQQLRKKRREAHRIFLILKPVQKKKIIGMWKSLSRPPMCEYASSLRDERYCRNGMTQSERRNLSYPCSVRS